jgi:beta-phosphoglucomutase-like phosphatase (HAD superfamily)
MQGQYAGSFPTTLIKPQELMRAMDFSNKEEIIERMNVEEMRNKDQELTNILNQSFEMMAQGATPDNVIQAALDQLHEMEQKQGLGSSSNSNNVQMSQQGANV